MNRERFDFRFLGAIGGTICLMPLMYVLSVGPAARLSEQAGPDVSSTVKRFYFPVIWLHDHTPLQKPLEWYVELWGVR